MSTGTKVWRQDATPRKEKDLESYIGLISEFRSFIVSLVTLGSIFNLNQQDVMICVQNSNSTCLCSPDFVMTGGVCVNLQYMYAYVIRS